MSKRKQGEQLSLFINLIERLKNERYRLAIACGPASSGKSQLVKAASDRLQADYIDLAVDLLPKIAMPGFSPTLGAYDADDLKDWILDKSYKPGVNFVIVDNIEPVLTTFGRVKVVEFFQIVSLVEPIAPMILVTYLTKQVKDANFPAERLFNLDIS